MSPSGRPPADRAAGAPVAAAPGEGAAPDPRRDPDDNYGAGGAGGRVGPEAEPPQSPPEDEDVAYVAWRGDEADEAAAREAWRLERERTGEEDSAEAFARWRRMRRAGARDAGADDDAP